MKRLLSKLAFLRYLTLFVAFALVLGACPGQNDPATIRIKSLKEAEKKIPAHNWEYMHLIVEMDLGDLSKPGNNYLRLLEIIGKTGKDAELSLDSCKMGGTTAFTSPPLNEAAAGMDRITLIYLPTVTKSITADTNGQSPFFFYENFKYISQGGGRLTTIGDYAFSFCKSLQRVNIYSGTLKTIGNGAFRGCENMEYAGYFYNIETIGDYAFFDCSSLGWLYFNEIPPSLGDSVFLGSTPGHFVLNISEEYSDIYHTWLAENASKFNNNGEDIVLR